ncbi:TPA: hypothetical protein HA265_05335 [Candidatus Woesearchaeota archaeon]|nr:hypothetical protein [Candidatus Woesearchaeota archaeon]
MSKEKSESGSGKGISGEENMKSVPSFIFRDRDLAPLESISEYLKEHRGLTYHEIAELLKRDDRTIWTCCNRAKKKREGKKPGKTAGLAKKAKTTKADTVPEKEKTEQQEIPIDIFHNRELAPLEGISKYLKENADKSFHEIAVLLNRDDRTIWTCYNRALKKQRLKQGLKEGLKEALKEGLKKGG